MKAWSVAAAAALLAGVGIWTWSGDRRGASPGGAEGPGRPAGGTDPRAGSPGTPPIPPPGSPRSSPAPGALPDDPEALLDILRTEADPARRLRACVALSGRGGPPVTRTLLELWRRDPDWRIRVALLEEIASRGGSEVDALLGELLGAPDETREGLLLQEAAAGGLAGRGTAEADDRLAKILRGGGRPLDGDPGRTGRVLALEALGDSGSQGSLALLESVATDPAAPADLRSEAVRALGLAGGEEAERTLGRLLTAALESAPPGTTEANDLRLAVVRSLSSGRNRAGSAEVLTPLVTGALPVPEEVRRVAILGLARSGAPTAADTVLAAARDASLPAATRRTAWFGYARAAGDAAIPILEKAAVEAALEEDQAAAAGALARIPGLAAREALARVAATGGGRGAATARSLLK